MNIRILMCLSGPGVSLNVGDVVDWDDEEVARLIDAGFAEIAEDPGAKSGKRGRANVVSADGDRAAGE